MEEKGDYPAKNTRKTRPINGEDSVSDKTGCTKHRTPKQTKDSPTSKSPSTPKTPKTPRTKTKKKSPQKVKGTRTPKATSRSTPCKSTVPRGTVTDKVKDIRSFFASAADNQQANINGAVSYSVFSEGIEGGSTQTEGGDLSDCNSEEINNTRGEVSSFYSATSSVNGSYSDISHEVTFGNKELNKLNVTIELESTIEWAGTPVGTPDQTMSTPQERERSAEDDKIVKTTEASHQGASAINTNTEVSDASSKHPARSNKDNRSNPKMSNNISKEIDTIKMLFQSPTESNSDKMDTGKVVEMFEKLMLQMESVKTGLSAEIQELKQEKNNNTGKIEEIGRKTDEIANEVRKIKSNNDFQGVKIDKLTETVARQNHVIQELSGKVERLQQDKLREHVVIHGIVEKKGENCTSIAQYFFKNTLELSKEIEVVKAFRLGKGKYRPLQVTIMNVHDKSLIYSNAEKLKDKTNEKKKSYRIEDVLPTRLAEKKRKKRTMVWRNKNRTTVGDRLRVEFDKGRLMVEGAPYKSQLVNPDNCDILKLKPEEILELQKVPVCKGMPVTHETSQFVGYVADIRSFEDANCAYEWVKYNNMGARHVIAAAKLVGPDTIYNVDFEDDNEHGGGKALLDYLDEAKIEGRAVFVARYYDGKHIGPKRFKCMINAVKLAMNQKPFNTVTQKFQFSWEKDEYNQPRSSNRLSDMRWPLNNWAEQTDPLFKSPPTVLSPVNSQYGSLNNAWQSQKEASPGTSASSTPSPL